MVTKKIAKSESITLPRQLRQATGMLAGVPIDIVPGEDGVQIRKHVPTCHFCRAAEDAREALGIEICRNCAGQLMEVFADEAQRD